MDEQRRDALIAGPGLAAVPVLPRAGEDSAAPRVDPGKDHGTAHG